MENKVLKRSFVLYFAGRVTSSLEVQGFMVKTCLTEQSHLATYHSNCAKACHRRQPSASPRPLPPVLCWSPLLRFPQIFLFFSILFLSLFLHLIFQSSLIPHFNSCFLFNYFFHLLFPSLLFPSFLSFLPIFLWCYLFLFPPHCSSLESLHYLIPLASFSLPTLV